MKIEGENAQVVTNKCNSFYSKCQERSDFMKKILILALSLILLLGVLPSCDSNPPEQSSSSEEPSESSSSALPNAPSNTPPKHENDLGYPMVVIDGVAKRNIKNINVSDDDASLPLVATLQESGAKIEWFNERVAHITINDQKKWILDIKEPYLSPYGATNTSKENVIVVSDEEYALIEKDIILPLSVVSNVFDKLFYKENPIISFDSESYIIDININNYDGEYRNEKEVSPLYNLSEDGTYYYIDGIIGYSSDSDYFNVKIDSTVDGIPVKEIRSLSIRRYYSYDVIEPELNYDSYERAIKYYYDKNVKIALLKIPNTIETISEGAFDISYIGEIQIDSNNKSFKYVDGILYSYDGKKLIRQINIDSLNEITVLEGTETIAKEAFKNNEKLTTVRLPSTLMAIEENAFLNCHRLVEIYNLSSLDIQAGNDENGMVAKYALGIYTSNDTPSAIKLINEDFVFFENEKIMVLVNYIGEDRVVNLPIVDREYKIGANAFRDNKQIFQIYIPSCVTHVSNGAFSGATNLYRVNLNSIDYFLKITFVSSPLEYGASIYVGGKCLKSVTITRDILRGAFKNCTSIEEVILAEGVSRIEDEAFRNCANLERVIMANTVVEIGSYAFADCNSLRELELSPSIREIPEGCFTECDFLRKIVIPKSVLKIKKRAFYGCNLLDTVKLHDNLDYVGSQAFANCVQLRVIYIPYGLPRANDAFDGVQVIQREYFD